MFLNIQLIQKNYVINIELWNLYVDTLRLDQYVFTYKKHVLNSLLLTLLFLNIPELVLKTVKRTGYQNERTLMTQKQRSVLSQK